jgi:uncharacterized protein (DUF1499 family)
MCDRKWVAFLMTVVSLLSANADTTTALPECLNNSHCVSSSAIDSAYHIDPFPIYKEGKISLTILAQLIQSLSRTKIIECNEVYLHATFESRIFRLIDDVEFLVNEEQKILEVRSASRLGFLDFGVNRKHLENLRALYLERIEE